MVRTALAGVVMVSALAAGGATAASEEVRDRISLTGATVDRAHDASIAGASLAYTQLAGDRAEAAATNLRLDLYAQYVNQRGGIYATFHATTFSGYLQDRGASIGNSELGGLYLSRAFPFPVVLRGGLVLPTSNGGQDRVTSRSTSFYPRLTDLSLAYPDATWIRLSVSPLVRRGRFVARADLGLDVPLDESSEDVWTNDPWQDIDSLIRLNLAAGADLGVASIMGELVTIGVTGYRPEQQDRYFHTLALTGRARHRGIEPYVSAIFPVDAPLDDEVWGATWIVMLGVDAALR